MGATIYAIKNGARIKTSAQIVGETCAALERKGELTAERLVEVSRPKDAPLHNEFEWRDKVAGQLWREQQARHIINSVVVVSEDKEPVRAFFNIDVKSAEYLHIETIMQSADSTDALLRTALRELSALEKKYGQLSALAEVWNAIRDAQDAQSA